MAKIPQSSVRGAELPSAFNNSVKVEPNGFWPQFSNDEDTKLINERKKRYAQLSLLKGFTPN